MIEMMQNGPDVLLHVKVVPGASRDKIAGDLDGALKISVAAPPERGAANKAVCELIARTCGLRRQQVEVESGHTSPRKVIRIHDVQISAIQAALQA